MEYWVQQKYIEKKVFLEPSYFERCVEEFRNDFPELNFFLYIPEFHSRKERQPYDYRHSGKISEYDFLSYALLIFEHDFIL